MEVHRSVVQAILAVVLVAGAIFILAWDREQRVPTEVLWSLVSLVVGFYFGASSAAATPTSGKESKK